jgi:hypothetical protein
VTESDELRQAIDENREYVCGETLAIELTGEPLAGVEPSQHDVGGAVFELFVQALRSES